MHGDGDHVATGDGRIYFERAGAGETVVIAPGGPGTGHAHYHPWFDVLAERFEVVWFDYLGTGRSDRPADPARYSIGGHAVQIEALRAHLGAERISVVGVSFGGMPALAYALAHPDRMRRLVLSNAQISAATWQEGNIDAVNAALREQFPERWDRLQALRAQGVRSLDDAYQELYDGLVDDLEWVDPYGHPTLRHDERNRQRVVVYAAVVGPDPEWEVTGAMAGFDPMLGMRDLHVPTLVATGRWDRLTTPRLARRAVEALPDGVAELVVFERSAHRPWAEQPDAYFATLARFLSGERPPR
jgi:proline iminopeptidase